MKRERKSVIELLRFLISKTLQHPVVFEWQQKACNTYGNIRKEFAEYYNRKSLKILDIGCSTGTCAGSIVDMKKHHYVGIDIEEEYIKRAKKLYPDGNFVVMDASNLNFDEEKFDLVTFNGVLHHMPDDLILKTAECLKSVLKDDGYVLIGEPIFTPRKIVSNFLLSLDRGRYIREAEGYKNLFKEYTVVREGFFPFSLHRFYSLVLRK